MTHSSCYDGRFICLFGLPIASIENRAGQAILAAYKKNPKNVLTWAKGPSNVKVEGGGAPAEMSSYGLDGDLRSKPDIGAPGGNIYGAYPRAKGSYALLSGTSMATPYYVGSQAMYYEKTKTKPSGPMTDLDSEGQKSVAVFDWHGMVLPRYVPGEKPVFCLPTHMPLLLPCSNS